jgi:hypothetical protein
LEGKKFFIDLLFALVIGILLTAVFALLFDVCGLWDVWWVFLLVVFLGAWAGGLSNFGFISNP